MSWPSPYVIPALVATALCVALAVAAWRRRPAPGVDAYLLLLVSGGIWAGIQFLDAIPDGERAKAFVAAFQYVGIAGAPLSYLAFVLAHCLGIEIRRHRGVMVALLAIPAISIGLAFTNAWHHLLWVELVSEPGMPIRAVRYGPWFAVHSTYLYLITAGGMLVALAQAIRSPANAGRLALLWLAPLCVMAANMLWLARILVTPLDPTPISFVLGIAATGVAIYRFRLLDTTPVSRAALIEGMGDVVIAIDARGRIADANRAAGEILACAPGQAVGAAAQDVLPAVVWRLARDESERASEIDLVIAGEERSFEARVSSISEGRGGTLLVLRDATARKRAERALAEARGELEAANAALARLATTDSLSGTATRAAFLDRLENELARSVRSGAPLGLLLLDVDHFKRVNDEHGHPAGDEVLAAIGECLLEGRRASDCAGRLGGEEFALLLCGIDLDGCRVVAERLRERIAALSFRVGAETLHITVSIGIATFPEHGFAAKALVAAADEALYAAKHAGRNCVRVAER